MIRPTLLLSLLNAVLTVLAAEHPRIYATPQDKASILSKIENEPWAAEAWERLLSELAPYTDFVQVQPDWLLSRMAMYWKPGERYTQCYITGRDDDGTERLTKEPPPNVPRRYFISQRWDYGEGDAPVPTVRLPGMRIWNDYKNVPLAERAPYNETGDMLAHRRSDPSATPVVVPYKESGHLIRYNNLEILQIAEKAAFAYWLTGEEKYARLAAGVYWTWLLGTYYMQPPLDPEESTGGPGGYAPGGMMGYYDYEQIHDDLMMHGAVIYDFLHDYLKAHPVPELAQIGKEIDAVNAEVFKRFIDIGFVRGQKTGNWNINGWNMMMNGILALGSDSDYADGKGREHYLSYYTTISTPYHDALPEILKGYDPVTGLWPESPGYAFGTIKVLLDMSYPISLAGVDTIGGNPMMQKAALAVFPWLDARGNMVVFGDTRGGPANFLLFERLLTYYQKSGDEANAALAAEAIQRGIATGQYDRAATGWKGIVTNAPLEDDARAMASYARTAWSPAHRHLVLKNGNEPDTALMLTLYGGGNINHHLRPNGLALQLYGRGYALAPDASAQESYWSDDIHYHGGGTGSNTILPGYKAGPITMNALEPAPAADAFTTELGISPSISFADVSADEKRRVVAIIRTSPTSGYYVDIFRSRQPDNDYLFHNLGDTLEVSDTQGQPLETVMLETVPDAPDPAYGYFTNVRGSQTDDDWTATWTLSHATPVLQMSLWMQGAEGREVYQVNAPPTTLLPALTPGGASLAPKPTPTIIVRQNGHDGWAVPFVAIAEPHDKGQASITTIRWLPATDTVAGAVIQSTELNQRRDLVVAATDDDVHEIEDRVSVRGHFAVITTNAAGLCELYLGSGRLLKYGDWIIEAESLVDVSLRACEGGYVCSSTGPATVTSPGGEAIHITTGKSQKLFLEE